MPNGGYPMHLLTPIGDSGISIVVSGQQVTLQQRVEPGSDSTHPHQPQFKKYGALTPDQTTELVSHLVTWMSADGDSAHESSPLKERDSADLTLPVEDSKMLLFISKWHVNVCRELEPENDASGASHSRYYENGALNEIQTAALLFHLFYWKGLPPNLDLEAVREDLGRQGFDLRAHPDMHGCFYDY